MHLCSLNTDVHQDDLTALSNDRLWERGEKRPTACITFPYDLVINKTVSLKVTLILRAAAYRSSLTW